MNLDPRGTRSGRRVLLRVLLLLSPLLLLLCAEVAVRVFVPRDEQSDPFLRLSGSSSKFGEVTVEGVRYYRVEHADMYAQNNVHFRVEKESGTLRVFCLGGSACAGWPHGPDHIWSRDLAEALRAAWPDRKVEVLNVGAHGWPSYRVRPVFDDVVRFQPDLMILWCGNNEFVERRSYATSASAQKLVRGVAKVSRLFELLLGAVVGGGQTTLPEQNREAAGFIFSQFEQQALELRTDPVQFAGVVDHYEYTVGAMMDAAREHHVPLIVLTVPSNLRDWHPNVSRNAATGDALTQWRAAFDRGSRELLDSAAPAAVESFAAARRSDPRHAETAFLSGRALEAAGRCEEARAEYRTAKDEDLTPFRALSVLNDRLRTLATRHPEVILVDMEHDILAAAKSCAPGFDLFLDYVHPTRAGGLVVARRVFDEIVARDLFRAAPATRDFAHVDDGYDDRKDLGVQLHVLYLLYNMHQEEAYRDAADAMIGLLLATGADPQKDPLVQLLTEGRDGIAGHLALRARALHGESVPADFEKQHQDWYRAHFARIQEVVAKARAGR
ncbi:MAG: GDSL-type esterase/lipase family protein [Planctomycetota bacterium]